MRREKPKRQMRIWAMFCHISALLAWIVLCCFIFLGLPLFLPVNILPPLMIWQLKKSQYPWIDLQGKEALNFQISLTFYTFVIIVISLFLMLASLSFAVTTNASTNHIHITLDSLLIVFMMFILLILSVQLFLVTFAGIKAYNGEHYRYPLTIRVLR